MTAHTRIEAYLPRLYGYAVSLAGDHHQAEDLVQECALRALTAKNTPGDEPAYRAWLFRILRNAFLDRVRRERTAALSADEVNFAPAMEFWQGDERLISIGGKAPDGETATPTPGDRRPDRHRRPELRRGGATAGSPRRHRHEPHQPGPADASGSYRVQQRP